MKREQQLANLRRGGRNGNTLAPGDRIALVHGGRSNPPAIVTDPLAVEIKSALEAAVPTMDARFDFYLQLAAADLARYRSVEAWLLVNGVEHRGRLRVRELDYQRQAGNSLREHLRELGMTPSGYAALGLDVARAGREATALADLEEGRRFRQRAAERGLVSAGGARWFG